MQVNESRRHRQPFRIEHRSPVESHYGYRRHFTVANPDVPHSVEAAG
jgi:hypothetical protein